LSGITISEYRPEGDEKDHFRTNKPIRDTSDSITSSLCLVFQIASDLCGIRAFLLHPTAFGDWVRHAFFVVTHSS
jgi:hypothetical protein